MNKSELINKLSPNNTPKYISAFFWGLVIGSIGFSLGDILTGLIGVLIGATVYGSVCLISAKLHPEATLSNELNCPLCKKAWSQRDGLIVLADRQCPHCEKGIELN